MERTEDELSSSECSDIESNYRPRWSGIRVLAMLLTVGVLGFVIGIVGASSWNRTAGATNYPAPTMLFDSPPALLPTILAEMKATLRERKNKAGRSLVVMGNTGGDMDSVADALTLATFLQNASFDSFLKHGYSDTQDGKCNKPFAGVSHADIIKDYGSIFPVINYPRKDFPLRKDEQYIISKLNIDEDSLIFIDEIEFGLETRFFLVDHNDIGNKSLDKQVDFVIDHHTVDESRLAGAKDCYIDLWGSCSSLVATFIKESTEKDGSNFLKQHPEWSTFLLAVMHLDWDKDKTIQADKDIMVEVAQWSMSSDYIHALKRDCTGFTLDQFFMKDEKHLTSGNMSISMPELQIENMFTFVAGKDAKETWSLKDFAADVSKFLEDHQYAAVFPLKVPDMSPPPGEFAVLTYNKELVKYMSDISHLKPNGKWYGDTPVDLKDASSDSPYKDIGSVSGLSQGYWTFSTGSRKQMLPMVEDMLEAFAASQLA